MYYIDRPSLLRETAIKIAEKHNLDRVDVERELYRYPNSFSLMISYTSEIKIVNKVKNFKK